jgi:hypothetical protein
MESNTNYEKFHAFQDIGSRRLPADTIESIHKYMGFTRDDLTTEHDEIRRRIADMEIEATMDLRVLKMNIDEAIEELENITMHLSPADERFKSLQEAIEMSRQRLHSARVAWNAEFRHIRQLARCIAAERDALP